MEKEDEVRTYSGVLPSHRKGEAMPFAATRTDPEMSALSEVDLTEKDR